MFRLLLSHAFLRFNCDISDLGCNQPDEISLSAAVSFGVGSFELGGFTFSKIFSKKEPEA